MRECKSFFVAMVAFGLLLLPQLQHTALAACANPAKIVGYSYAPTSLQDAYNHASTPVVSGGLGLSDFTLQVAGEVVTEDLLLDGGNVTLDGGYDCNFSAKTGSSSGLFGTLTIRGGSATIAGDVNVVSTDQCSFDSDLDGYFTGSCAPLPLDCNDNDPAINPGAAEVCDGIDNNCDLQIDEGVLPTDADGDGYFDANSTCGDPALNNDCQDLDPSINPGALDIPFDGIDQDCSGADMTFAGESCSACHNSNDPGVVLAGPQYWTDKHAGITAPAPSPQLPSCETCHNAAQLGMAMPGHYGDTVLTDGNNMTAGQLIFCVACHDMNVANHPGGPLGSAANIVWDKVDPTHRGNVNCDHCHETRAAVHNDTTQAHNNRIIDASCAACHTSDPTVLGSPGTGSLLSAADVDSLHGSDCALCHTYSGTRLNAAVVRQVIEDGVSGTPVSCLDCHTAQATNHGNRIHTIEQGGDLSAGSPCSSCHNDSAGNLATWDDIYVEHLNSCALCHSSARTEVVNAIAAGANPTTCLVCHPANAAAHGSADHEGLGHVTRAAVCVTCHDQTAVLDTVVNIHNNNCALCHAGIPTPLQTGLSRGDCVNCHIDSPVPGSNTWEGIHSVNTPNHNPPVGVGTTECIDCHTDTLYSVDADTHAGCSNCHDANGGTISRASGVLFGTGDCVTCHTEAWNIIHTAPTAPTPNHGMIVTTTNTSCTPCHDDTLTSAALTTHNDCTSCHDTTTGRLLGRAAGVTAPGNCVTCHNEAWDFIHTNANTPSHIPPVQIGTTTCGTSRCHSTPPPLVDNNDPEVHDTCASCHNLDGTLTSLAVGKTFDNPTDNCATCHTGNWDATHVTVPDHVALVTTTGTTCGTANCHDDTLVGVDAHNDCATCHDATTGALLGNAIGKDFDIGGNCTTCHGSAWQSIHSTNVTPHTSLVTVTGTGTGGTACSSCHDDTLASAAANTHAADCSNCHNGTGGLINSAVGKSFTTGGTCLTCHTGGFDAHSHVHDLSYNPTTDTSQAAQQGCVACHNDSLGNLATFADIVTEHTNCSRCHNYTDDGNGTPPQLTVENTIATGTGVTCATCHTPKVPNVDHGVDHILDGLVTGEAACLVCHVDPATTFTDPGNAKIHNGCTTCHDAGTNALKGSAVNHGALDAGFGNPNTCTSCHTGRDWTDHNIDHATAGYLSLHSECTSCHATTMTAGAGFIGAADGDQKHDACTSCHAVDGAITVAVNDCSECHSGVTGDWATHAEDHTAKVTAAAGCTSCHSATVDYVAFTSAVDNLKHDDCFVCHNATTKLASAAAGDCSQCHSGVTGDFSTHTTNDHTGLVTQATGCASCHSSTVDYVTFVDPANNLKHDACATCHNATTNAPIQPAGDCSQCHSSVTGDFTNHISQDHTTKVTLATSCAECHTETVDYANFIDAANNKKHDTCATCHDATTNAAIQPAGDCSQCHSDPYHTNDACTLCHGGANDVDNFANDSIASQINTGAEWTTYGHGNDSLTSFITNANGGDPCLWCHDVTAGHEIDDTNAFRLKGNNALGNGWNDACLVCHDSDATTTYNAGEAGFTTINRSLVSKVDKYHQMGAHAASGNNGGNFCWDCHDPHGDLMNIKMIQGRPAQVTDGTFGIPTTQVATDVIFTNNTVPTGAGGWAMTSGNFGQGVCNACHTNSPTNPKMLHYNNTASDGHNSGTVCSSCHDHSADTINDGNAFAGAGACDACHAYPPDPGDGKDNTGGDYLGSVGGKGAHTKHVNHVATLAGVTLDPSSDSYGDVTTTAVCGVCHDMTGGAHETAGGSRNINFNGDTTYQFGPSAPNWGAPNCSNVSCHFKPTPDWE